MELVLSMNLNRYIQPCAGRKMLQVDEVNHSDEPVLKKQVLHNTELAKQLTLPSLRQNYTTIE